MNYEELGKAYRKEIKSKFIRFTCSMAFTIVVEIIFAFLLYFKVFNFSNIEDITINIICIILICLIIFQLGLTIYYNIKYYIPYMKKTNIELGQYKEIIDKNQRK